MSTYNRIDPIFKHIREGNDKYVSKNIHKYNTSDKDPCNYSCLLGNAIYFNHAKIVNIILDQNIEYTKEQLNYYGSNIIQQAVHRLSDIGTLERVILRYKDMFNIDKPTEPVQIWHMRYPANRPKYLPPLFIAINEFDPEKVLLLLELGADPLLSYQGKTALMFAESKEMQDALTKYKISGFFNSESGIDLFYRSENIVNMLREAESNLWTDVARQLYEDESKRTKRQRTE